MAMEVIGSKSTIVYGKVVDIRRGTGAAEGRVMNVTLAGQVWNGTANEDKTIEIAFWDNSANDGPNMVSRVEQAIKMDSYIMVRCQVHDGKYTGYDFKFKGQFVIETDTDKVSVTLGHVTHKLDKNGKMRYSVPVEVYENGETVTKWYGINFSQKKSAAAEKMFASSDKARQAVLIGFEPQSNIVGDKEYVSIVVYQFEVTK